MSQPTPPAAPKSLVTEGHFRLLQEFGRSLLRKKLDEKQQADMWRMSCAAVSLPFVPHDEVMSTWRAFITGESLRSGLAANGDVDPEFTTIGVTFDRRLAAAHTIRTVAILRRILSIYRRIFPSDEAYLESVRGLAVEACATRPKKKRG